MAENHKWYALKDRPTDKKDVVAYKRKPSAQFLRHRSADKGTNHASNAPQASGQRPGNIPFVSEITSNFTSVQSLLHFVHQEIHYSGRIAELKRPTDYDAGSSNYETLQGFLYMKCSKQLKLQSKLRNPFTEHSLELKIFSGTYYSTNLYPH